MPSVRVQVTGIRRLFSEYETEILVDFSQPPGPAFSQPIVGNNGLTLVYAKNGPGDQDDFTLGQEYVLHFTPA